MAKESDGEPEARRPHALSGSAVITWQDAGYKSAIDYDSASVFQKTLFSYASAFLQRGKQNGLQVLDAGPLLSSSDRLSNLVAAYSKQFAKESSNVNNLRTSKRNLLLHSLLRSHAPLMALQSFLLLLESLFRLLSPVGLRQFIQWLRDYEDPDQSPQERYGWMWAGLLIVSQLGLALSHHQLFWCGMRLGFLLKQQAIAAVQEKLLRLNSATFNHISTGQIVNLVSNDVRRFDEFGPFWVFGWGGPLEALAVLVMIGMEIGWWPAIAGVSTLLLVIPIQVKLAGRIGSLRMRSATQTDERVRITGEVVEGAANVKMLCWEEPFRELLGRIRRAETGPMRTMLLIDASCMALMFFCVPVACVVTFGTAVAMGTVLKLESVFYVVALLNLPKLWLALFFVKAVKSLSEMVVATNRIFSFIQELEARAPAEEDPHDMRDGEVEFNGASFAWGSRAWEGQPDVLPGDSDPDTPKADDSKSKKGHPAATTDTDIESQRKPGIESRSSDSKEVRAPTTLHSLEFKIAPGEFVGIAGEVGSGKSSLLSALLGELQPIPQPGYVPGDKIEGAPRLRGRVAYCQQVPWIEAGTVRDNIVFGSEFESEWYANVKTACALDHDVAQLPAGDDTEIGERGINLSGGQKARLALARAAYARPAIALLDDPLSAVDPKVAQVLFQKCIGPEGLLRHATRILVTHQTQWLHSCSRVMVLQAGTVIADAPWATLQDSANAELQSILFHHGQQMQQDPSAAPKDSRRSSKEEPFPDGMHGQLQRETAMGSAALGAADSDATRDSARSLPAIDPAEAHSSPMAPVLAQPGQEEEAFHSVYSTATGVAGLEADDSVQPAMHTNPVSTDAADSKEENHLVGLDAGSDNKTGKEDAHHSPLSTAVVELAAVSKPDSGTSNGSLKEGQLTQAEHREKGALKGNVFLQYASAMGSCKVAVILLALVLGQATWIMSEWWLARWSQSSAEEQRRKMNMKLWVYGTLVASIIALSLFRNLGWFVTALAAGTHLNARMLDRVLRSKLSFFHTTPTGRILNVFSKDQGSIDEQLPQVTFDALQTISVTIGAVILISVANWPIIPIFLPLAYVFFQIRQYYLVSSREVKRLEAVTRSPVYAMFSATIKGLPTIRAFGATKRFRTTFLDALDLNGSWWIAYINCARWVGARMDAIAFALLASSVIVAMAARSLMSASILALALTHLLQLSGSMQWAVRQTAEAENHMTSVERVLAYTRLPQERAATIAAGGSAPPKGWPSSAKLEFDNVEARYRRGLPPVLKDLSFTIPSGATCGVVGRTGSGKSSLLLALFELIDITGGRVLLDGQDVAKVALDYLRQQIAIIPQDPLLFSGSLRANLDPWGSKSDEAVWAALRSVQLEAAVTALGGLRTTMSEAGGNFSAGQRQLLCLARALLTEARVLALDEATANVDRVTDSIIQSTLRSAVKGADAKMERIMLVIAHRVDTIYDCDQLLVLSDGRLVQSGSPRQLAEIPGHFSQLVQAARANEQSDKTSQSPPE